MATRSFEAREAFHLALLSALSRRLSGRAYAVKGGICLRFFHRSPRLSEDLDLDVVSSVRIKTLEHAVDSVLGAASLPASLAALGVIRIGATKPKQTETTQRWKIALSLAGGGSLATKLEFSRRREDVAFSSGIPDARLLGQYRLPGFAAQYYDGPAMALQKILALASPQRNALRDLFDLHHLFYGGVTRLELPEPRPQSAIEAAVDKVSGFSFAEFRDQVVPYLPDSLVDLYRDSSVFDRQKAEVEQALIGLLR